MGLAICFLLAWIVAGWAVAWLVGGATQLGRL